MRKVLVPSDFSANANNALAFATELFKYEKAEFFIIHTYAEEVYSKDVFISKAIFEEMQYNEKALAEEGLKDTKSYQEKISPNPKHNYHYLAKHGLLIDEINDLVEKENMDIVVMGTRGLTNDRKLTIGSNTLQVIKFVKCPVLTIPEDFAYSRPKTIVFATDFNIPYKRRELKLLSTMGKSYRSEIILLYVSVFEKLSHRQQQNKSFIENELEENSVHYYRIEGNEVEKELSLFLSKRESDMLVMVNSKHSYMENILYHSTLDKIELNSKKPFLILQNLNR